MNQILGFYSVHDRIWSGFIAFGLCAFYGLRFLFRGIRNDILDASGMPIAGRLWFIIGGILMVLPLIAFTYFTWRQGYFGSQY